MKVGDLIKSDVCGWRSSDDEIGIIIEIMNIPKDSQTGNLKHRFTHVILWPITGLSWEDPNELIKINNKD